MIQFQKGEILKVKRTGICGQYIEDIDDKLKLSNNSYEYRPDELESTGWVVDDFISKDVLLEIGSPVLYCGEITEIICYYSNDTSYIVKYSKGWIGSGNHIEKERIDKILNPKVFYHYADKTSVKLLKKMQIVEMFPIY